MGWQSLSLLGAVRVIGLLFPGQGAQQVGMGKALAGAIPVARDTFAEANDVLGYDVTALIFDGPVEVLVPTDICQSAILVTLVVVWRAARDAGLEGDLVMGHSLGEFSALVASGSLPFDVALRIVAERGAAMHAAGQEQPGTMAALLGLTDLEAEALCTAAGDVWPANYNCPGQVVASGSLDGIKRLLDLAAARGHKATPLAVGGAFHSPLMAAAAARLGPALDAWTPREPDPAFFSTTTVAVEGSDRLRQVIFDQLLSPVRFGASIEAAMDRGVTRFVEMGPGRVLSGLVKRINREVPTMQIQTPDDLAKVLA